MKIGLIKAGVIVLVGSVPLSAWASNCPTAPIPSVRVQLLDPQAKISTSKSLKQINSLAKGHGLVRRGKVVLGTTESRVTTELSIQFIWTKRRGTQRPLVCVHVKSLKVRFGNRKLLVSLPREYAPQSCQYKVVYRHEMAHVAVNRQAARKYAVILQSELSKELRRSNTIETTTMSRGTSAFQKRLKRTINAVTRRYNKEIKGLHGKIDAAGSPYSADGTCRSW